MCVCVFVCVRSIKNDESQELGIARIRPFETQNACMKQCFQLKRRAAEQVLSLLGFRAAMFAGLSGGDADTPHPKDKLWPGFGP